MSYRSFPTRPQASEVAALGLSIAPRGSEDRGENPLVSAGITAVAGSASSSGGKDQCTVVHSESKKPSESPSTTPGFSLGHGFPLIPPKLVVKIQKWEYVSMAELLPDNLELTRRSQFEGQRSSYINVHRFDRRCM